VKKVFAQREAGMAVPCGMGHAQVVYSPGAAIAPYRLTSPAPCGPGSVRAARPGPAPFFLRRLSRKSQDNAVQLNSLMQLQQELPQAMSLQSLWLSATHAVYRDKLLWSM